MDALLAWHSAVIAFAFQLDLRLDARLARCAAKVALMLLVSAAVCSRCANFLSRSVLEALRS